MPISRPFSQTDLQAPSSIGLVTRHSKSQAPHGVGVCSAGLSECLRITWQSDAGSSAAIHHHAFNGVCSVKAGRAAHTICHRVKPFLTA